MIDTDKPLPARQKDVLNLIVKMSDEHGYPPTLAELASALGLKNRMTVHQHVAALKKKGLVHWEPGLNRSLRVLTEGLKHLDESLAALHPVGEDLEESVDGSEVADSKVVSMPKRSPARSVERASGIPMAGAIAAGQPIDALESRDYLEIDSQYSDAGCFALKVKGESMIEDGIYDGDFVIVKPNPSPSNGEVVVALLDDGSATLKRFYKERGGFRLQPANSEMEPIFIDGNQSLTIQGTVVALFRKFN